MERRSGFLSALASSREEPPRSERGGALASFLSFLSFLSLSRLYAVVTRFLWEYVHFPPSCSPPCRT